MNELQRRFNEHNFKHDKGCRFEQQIKGFAFDGMEISLHESTDIDYEQIAGLTMKYCPYCGFDIDASVAKMLIIKQRTKELIESSTIKLDDWIWIKKPNNKYWKGRGFKSKVTDICYQEHSDRLLYRNSQVGIHYMSCTIEDIELYTNQPICNP